MKFNTAIYRHVKMIKLETSDRVKLYKFWERKSSVFHSFFFHPLIIIGHLKSVIMDEFLFHRNKYKIKQHLRFQIFLPLPLVSDLKSTRLQSTGLLHSKHRRKQWGSCTTQNVIWNKELNQITVFLQLLYRTL